MGKRIHEETPDIQDFRPYQSNPRRLSKAPQRRIDHRREIRRLRDEVTQATIRDLESRLKLLRETLTNERDHR